MRNRGSRGGATDEDRKEYKRLFYLAFPEIRRHEEKRKIARKPDLYKELRSKWYAKNRHLVDEYKQQWYLQNRAKLLK